VQNIDGTGVIATGTGSENSLFTSFANSTPIDQLAASPFSELIGSIDGTTLTVTALTGNLAIGDLLTGPGLAPDTKISDVLSSFDPFTGTGSYSLNRSQALNSSTLEAVSNPAPISSKELGRPYSSFNGSITGTILNISQLSVSGDSENWSGGDTKTGPPRGASHAGRQGQRRGAISGADGSGDGGADPSGRGGDATVIGSRLGPAANRQGTGLLA
jgi:hypothetical protein